MASAYALMTNCRKSSSLDLRLISLERAETTLELQVSQRVAQKEGVVRSYSPMKSSDGLHFAARSAKSDVSPTFGRPGMSSRYPLPVSIDKLDRDFV